MNQLTDAIHFYGSKASISVQVTAPQGYGVYTTQGETGGPAVPEKPPLKENDLPSAPQSKAPPIQPFRSGPEQAITEELMEDVIQKTIERIRYYKNCGFDMCTLHMAYRATLLSKFLSPLTNKRTDEYGGSMENRAKFPLRLCAAIKEAFGKDFLIEAQVRGEDGKLGGNTTDDLVEFAHLAEGVIDILQIRAGNADDAHPTGFNSVKTEPMTLRYAEAVKKSGAKIIAEPIGGFQNPDDMERYLAEGKADMFGMARSYICDFEYGKKIEEGRGEDRL